MKKELINYAKGMDAQEDVFTFLEKRVLTQEQIDQSEAEHIIDYLCSDNRPKRIEKATYEAMKNNAEKWIKILNNQAKDITEKAGEDYEVVLDFKDGFKIVKIISENSYKREGKLMRHCVSSYFGKDDEIYSLRDAQNKPHATISKSSQQIKGKGNGSIHPNYITYIVKFLEYLKIDVRDSEMKNLGYINVKKFKKDLSKDNKLFKNEYHYLKNQLLNKDNEEFACFELWDMIPLVDIDANIYFKLSGFIPQTIKYMISKIKPNKSTKENSKDDAQIGSSGDSAQIGSSGDSAQIGSSGNSAKIGSSGNYAQIGSSGNYAQIGSSGNSAQIGSSGDSAQIGSSGNSAQIGSSGYYAKIGSSGNYAQIGSSGDSAKIGSSGNSAQIGSSGNSAQIGSSGYSAKIEVKGDLGVCAAIGVNSEIKGKLGTWITLAEYDNNNKPICVKSAQIDGKKLKADTWYELKNKRFKMVK